MVAHTLLEPHGHRATVEKEDPMNRHTIYLRNTGFRFLSIRSHMLKHTTLAIENVRARRPEKLYAGRPTQLEDENHGEGTGGIRA